jgi:DNA topoisomerase-3
MLITVIQRETKTVFIKNYDFDYTFPGAWGGCQVTMTSVVGHIMSSDFGKEYGSWSSSSPLALFEAPIITTVDDVSFFH